MTTLVRGSWELTYTFNEIRGDVGAPLPDTHTQPQRHTHTAFVADRLGCDADLTCSKVQNRAVRRVQSHTHTHTHRFDAQHGADHEVRRSRP
jgi:hypothetical protein